MKRRKRRQRRRRLGRLNAEKPVTVICDGCKRKQTNRHGNADAPAGCIGCGHHYGTYA